MERGEEGSGRKRKRTGSFQTLVDDVFKKNRWKRVHNGAGAIMTMRRPVPV